MTVSPGLGAGLRVAKALGGVAVSAAAAPSGSRTRVVRQAADVIDRVVGPAPADWLDAGWSHVALQLLQEGADTARLLAGDPRTALACEELADKVAAFDFFRHAETLCDGQTTDRHAEPDSLRDPAGGTLLDDVVRARAGWSPHQALWIVEGLGHGWAARHTGDTGSLVAGASIARLGGWSLPIHTGAGLAWARASLARGDARGTDRDPDGAARIGETEPPDWLVRFRQRIERGAEPALAGAAFEALGLAARLDDLDLRVIDAVWSSGHRRTGDAEPPAEKRRAGPEVAERARFWHGAGRGLYFTGGGILVGPDAAWRALSEASAETPSGLPRRNLIAGHAWAITLVNLRNPRVLERVLLTLAGRLDTTDRAALGGGVGGALDLWRWVVGPDAMLASLGRYRPAPGAGRRALWDATVGDPARRRLAASPHPPDFMVREPMP